jgi:Zn-dependent protease with chaperone function
MDFFTAQLQAQRKSRWLVLWFALAVISIITMIYLGVTFWVSFKVPAPALQLWDGKRFFWTFLLVGGGIAVASLYKVWEISRHGGKLIAEQLGGRMITRDTNGLAEKRLLNVIDEMSIAAGIPAPVAFVLTGEPRLNAFAAGLSTQDSVIGVTHGLLETMNRDELQGVIGHEISHIVNGDSRLNIKLIGTLFGIYSITLIGRGMMRARGKNSAPIVLSGLVLCTIGSIGLFFGRLIQAAVSREREYLADASAVQFTRYPSGLISALRKLRSFGSQIDHPQATAASHLFFGTSGSSLFATHPPLSERIRRIGGIFLDQPDGEKTFPFGANDSLPMMAANPHTAMPVIPAIAAVASLPEEISPENLSQAQILLADLPDTLRQQAGRITGATGIFAGLLFSSQPDIRLQQEALLPPDTLPTAQALHQWLSAQPEQGAPYRLVWLDLVLPTLREALEANQQQLLVLAKDLICIDGRVSPTEFALYSLLRGALSPPSEHWVRRSEIRLKQLDQDISALLALLAHAGHEDVESAQAAYQKAIACSPANTKHPFPEKAKFSFHQISDALTHLALASPPYRKRLLDACMVAIQYDGKITPVEKELLRAFAQSLNCPAPLS